MTFYVPFYTARLAIQNGAAGIIVSNHGARQLDYVPSTIMALEEVTFSSKKISYSQSKNVDAFLRVDWFAIRVILTDIMQLQVVKAAQGRVPVFLDGGVRRGTDVFKALALGASGIFVSTKTRKKFS